MTATYEQVIMALLERQTQLAELDEACGDAEAGTGSLVLVTGEAGAGKTSLVRQFANGVDPGRVLWGLCDDLATPRPLGPFRDVAIELGGLLAEVVTSGDVTKLTDTLLEELDQPPRPVVLVIEDAHWADGASLDVIRFLGRRVDRLRVLLIVTYRDEEASADHPLREMLGAIPATAIRRIGLEPLSREAVKTLAGRSEVDELYRLTGGNPFYVNEMLASQDDSGVPPSVQEAVLSRVRRLDDQGRTCVETASVIPTRIERWLLEDLGVSSGLDGAVGAGVLQMELDSVSFSHELVRRAVEANLSPGLRENINQQVLDTLITHEEHPARLTHHAGEANDTEALARFAPIAARRAASLDSHREAVAHFQQALANPEQHSREELATLSYDYARECYLTENHETAAGALHRAIDLHRETGDQEELGSDLSLLSDVYWFLGSGEDADEAARSAVSVLESVPAGTALGMAYAQRAKLAMVDRRRDEAIELGNKAADIARAHDDTRVLAHALNTVGTAQWTAPPFDNRPLLESLKLARSNRLPGQASRAYSNLADGYLNRMEYDLAGHYLEEGLAFCDAHDLITALNRLLSQQAALHLEQGRWQEAEEDVRYLATSAGHVNRSAAQTVLSLLHVRRGDPAAEETLEEAQRLAEATGDTQDVIPVGVARLELAWLNGDLEDKAPLASEVFDLADDAEPGRWWMGESALWLHRVGLLDEPPSHVIEPYALQIAGKWEQAAAAWSEMGRPYAEADALGDAHEPEPLLEALEILDRLGAKPRAGMVRRRLREMGVTRIPRGPREPARTSPAGLTARQTEVLRLLAEDLTYREIADRLYVSAKTVDHHVSAVRTKLGVSTRSEAVEEGRRLGIISSDDP